MYPSFAERHEDTQYAALELLEVPASRTSISSFSQTGIDLETDADDVNLLHIPIDGTRIQSGGHQGHEPPAVTRLPRNPLSRYQGWQLSATLFFYTAVGILVINIGVLIYAALLPTVLGLSVAYRGDCGQVTRLSAVFHVAINITSSILLAASNFAMQCLSAPTRSDIDAAHKRGRWMEIGIPSIRNLGLVRRRRATLWVLLALSSVPIHLVYNAAVFKTTSANAYNVLVITPKYIDSGEIMQKTVDQMPWFKTSDTSGIRNFTAEDCLRTYSTSFVSDYASVILVTNGVLTGNGTAPRNGTLWTKRISADSYWNSTAIMPYSWMCYAPVCRGPRPSNAHNWAVPVELNRTLPNKIVPSSNNNSTTIVNYCLAEQVEPQCELQLSVQAMVVVVLCNLCKVIAIWFLRKWSPGEMLLALGDALASFLDQPDPTAKDLCLLTRRDVKGHMTLIRTSLPGDLRCHRNDSVLRDSRTAILGVLVCAMMIGAGILLRLGTNGSVGVTSTGFGQVDPRTMLGLAVRPGAAGFMAASLLANTPLALLSCLYLLWNSCFTSMHMATEYSKFASQRQPLRVTSPSITARGKQWKTYWLQLPLRYGIPMIVTSSLMHWITSQALFPVQLIIRDRGESVRLFLVGYSVAPIVAGLAVGGAMVLVTLAMSQKPLQSNMPVVGSCSWAIAAACQRLEDDLDAAVLPVQWGEVCELEYFTGHCCFTSKPVRGLVKNRFYK